MSWHYSRALVAAYLAESSTDGERFALLRSSDMPATYCWHDKTTEALPLFQYGTTCEHSTADPGEDLLTWYLAAFPARMSVLPAQCGAAPAWPGAGPLYGGRCSELLTRYARPRFLVKTRPTSESSASLRSSTNLPASGMFVDGLLSALIVSDLIINVAGYGSTLPTPTARDWKDTPGMNPTRKDGKTRTDRLPMLLFYAVRDAGISLTTRSANMAVPTVTLKGLAIITIMGQDYCPELPEWLMGWPIGWTDLQPLETDKFQRWQLWHGIS